MRSASDHLPRRPTEERTCSAARPCDDRAGADGWGVGQDDDGVFWVLDAGGMPVCGARYCPACGGRLT